MVFARWVFRIAGVYGLLAILPMYFLEDRIGRDQPPAVTHPEFFYGFLGVILELLAPPDQAQGQDLADERALSCAAALC